MSRLVGHNEVHVERIDMRLINALCFAAARLNHSAACSCSKSRNNTSSPSAWEKEVRALLTSSETNAAAAAAEVA